ncbi:hypothetical protein L1D44_15080 [Shewanella sp. Isolate13]|uniref:hypothetical protein n=1 Tax=Shewanella sp. Isolate13 TaxID=2908531 RepID=UPI001EFE726B|nr:hypothetical protein [Shewanella sp. Isolate13]MCG9731121.1 hypothetical protein [Shewanella sp. Isolate13]
MCRFDDCKLFADEGVHSSGMALLGQDLLNASVSYKLEEVYGDEGVIGYEVLIDNVGVAEGRVFNAGLLMDRLFYFIENNKRVYQYDFEGKSLFVNFETYEFCDSKLLKKIVEFSHMLERCGMELVCEITERNMCSTCQTFKEGLRFLKKHAVHLCADDFDWQGGDYREGELTALFSSIKLQVPSVKGEYLDFASTRDWHELSKSFEFIVFERIETVAQLLAVKLLNTKRAYYQGFLLESRKITVQA